MGGVTPPHPCLTGGLCRQPAGTHRNATGSQWLGCLLSALLGAGVVISLQGLAGRSANVRDVDAP